MQISSKLSEDEISKFKQEFYDYFETGYEFEEFLKEYLLKMGLDEVEITQRSRDGGVDLKAIRKGVGDFSDIDITHYYVQAKRYSPPSATSTTSPFWPIFFTSCCKITFMILPPNLIATTNSIF